MLVAAHQTNQLTLHPHTVRAENAGFISGVCCFQSNRSAFTTEAFQCCFFIINQRYNRKKVTLFTTNYGGVKERGGFTFDREEIKRGGEEESLEERIGYRLRSRLFDMARLVEVVVTDYRRDVLARLKK